MHIDFAADQAFVRPLLVASGSAVYACRNGGGGANLQEYTRHASEDRGEAFRNGSTVVTALAYFFRDAASYDSKFVHLQGALLETWRHCGILKTVVVTNQVGAALAKFAARYPWVEIQIESALVPGDIDTLSRDCISKLGERFTTPYVLTVQDDGFPLRDGLQEFVDLGYDYFGAPFIRWLAYNDFYPYRYNVGNGGFSLRSRRLCLEVGRIYRKYFSHWPFIQSFFCDDMFYSRFLRCFWPGYNRRFRFAPPEIAGCFSIELNLDFMPKDVKPFGFHSKVGWTKWWAL